MSALKIPATFDDDLLSRAAAGESTRDIAAWLRDEHHIADCSHMAVSRRLQALSLKPTGRDESLSELDGQLRAQLLTLNELHQDLEDLGELAELPLNDPRRGDLDTKKFSILNRRLIALAVFRHLTTRRREAIVTRARDERLNTLLERLPLNDGLERVENELRDVQAADRARRERTTPPPQKSVVAARPPPPPSLKGADRNKPCSCGSGRKAKKCCLSTVAA